MSNTSPAPVKARGSKRPAAARAATSTLKVAEDTIHELAELFKQLADKNRLKILLALAQDQEMHVNALCDLLKQSQPAVSHHLNLLRGRRLVTYRRDGKHNFYRIDCAIVRTLLEEFFEDTGNGHKHIQFGGFSLHFKAK